VANWKTVSTHRFDTDAFKDAQLRLEALYAGFAGEPLDANTTSMSS